MNEGGKPLSIDGNKMPNYGIGVHQGSRIKISNFGLRIANLEAKSQELVLIANFEFRIADFKMKNLLSSDLRPLTSDLRLLSAFVPSAYCLVPSIFLLPVASCLLPQARLRPLRSGDQR